MILLIDGPSGAGKTTFARQLAQILGWQLVHMDDLYPGWDGLQRGSEIVVSEVLRQRRVPTWDWDLQRPGAVQLLQSGHLIIEGVGALTDQSLAAARELDDVLSIVLDGSVHWRQQRALSRDPEYVPFWQQWAQQEARHFATMPTPDVRWWEGRPVRRIM